LDQAIDPNFRPAIAKFGRSTKETAIMKTSILARIGSFLRTAVTRPVAICTALLHLPLRLLEVVMAVPEWLRERRKTRRQQLEEIHQYMEASPRLAKLPVFYIRTHDGEGGTLLAKVPVLPHQWRHLGIEPETIVDAKTGKDMLVRLRAMLDLEAMLNAIPRSSLHDRLPDSE
jgi:hypothetical protein